MTDNLRYFENFKLIVLMCIVLATAKDETAALQIIKSLDIQCVLTPQMATIFFLSVHFYLFIYFIFLSFH